MLAYSPVIRTCSKCVMLARAEQLFDEMQQQGLQPNVVTYCPVIRARGKCVMLERT